MSIASHNRYCVVGCSKGIGLELVRLLLSKGRQVYGCARTAPPDDVASHALFRFVSCDITQPEQIPHFTGSLVSAAFVPDVVYYCAGVYDAGGLSFNDPDLHRLNREVNYTGIVNMHESLFQHLPESDTRQYILLSSLFAFIPDRRNYAYAGSKAAVSMYFRSLASTGVAGIFKIVYLGPVQTGINTRPLSNNPASPVAVANKLYCIAGRSGTSFIVPAKFWLLYIAWKLLPEKLLLAMLTLMTKGGRE